MAVPARRRCRIVGMTGAPHDRFACDERFPAAAVLRLARRAVARHQLDLSGLRVLTEATVGYGRVTAVLAAMAGADAVFAVSRDTPQASRKAAEEQTAWLARLAGVQERVQLFSTRLQTPLATVDVVTDLPGVRPIDEAITRNLPETAVVTLMRGVDHWRAGDVDAATCRRAGVAVAGVDEDAIGLYRYVPMEAVWGLLSLGLEIAGATVIVAGGGQAYAHVVRALAALRAEVLVATPETAGRIDLYGGRKIGDGLADAFAGGRLAEADALILCPGSADERFTAPAGAVDAARLAAAAPHLAVISQDAEPDRRAFAATGLRTWPAGDGGAAPASLFELLPQPVIELHAAGLKVGEALARARRRGSSALAAEQLAAAEAHAEQLPKDLGPRRS
jgi:hypothetical protein